MSKDWRVNGRVPLLNCLTIMIENNMKINKDYLEALRLQSLEDKKQVEALGSDKP